MSELAAAPDTPDDDQGLQDAWLKRWGGSPIEIDDDHRWSIFDDGWTPFPGKQSQQHTAWLGLHVMSECAIGLLDEDGGIDHWRRWDPATYTWRRLSEAAIRALLVAIVGTVSSNAHANGAVNLLDACAQGPRVGNDSMALQRPRLVPVSELDANSRYRASPSGIADLDENRLITDPDEIAALGLWATKSYHVEVEIDFDLNDPDAAERIALLDDSFADPESADYFWDEAGYSGRGLPSGRVVVLMGPSRAGKSTVLSALLHSEGDFAQGGRVSDLTKAHHEPRFSVDRAWCQVPIVCYDDGPEEPWHWSSILPGSGGATMICEEKNGAHWKAPSISTAFIAMNPDRLRWVGVNKEGAPERLRIIRFKARSPEDRDPEDKLTEWGYHSVQELVTKDEILHKAVVARRIRKQSERRHPPRVPAHIAENNDVAVSDAYPPLEGWLLGLFEFGEGLCIEGWDSVLIRAGAEHPRGALEEWRLGTDDETGKLWLTVPKKGRGTERIDSVEVASRVRSLFKAEFKEHGVTRRTHRIDNRTVGWLHGVGMRPKEPDTPTTTSTGEGTTWVEQLGDL